MKSLILFIFFTLGSIIAQKSSELPLNSTDGLTLKNVKAEVVDHNGKTGIKVTKADNYQEGETIVLLPDIEFQNGTIELELTGEPAPGAAPTMRGFVGVAFHIDPDNSSSYDCFYLRPTNGRAENQLQRNHSVQYVAHPEFPWHKLRKENPGVYESYVDLVPGEWTKVKIEVSGQKARLYLHGNEQPTLIVNDLKHDEQSGSIGLWLHSSTLARYRNLIVTHK